LNMVVSWRARAPLLDLLSTWRGRIGRPRRGLIELRIDDRRVTNDLDAVISVGHFRLECVVGHLRVLDTVIGDESARRARNLL